MTTRHTYTEELEKLKSSILTMSGLAEEAIGKAIKALSSSNKDLADEIIQEDSRINEWEDRIEQLCVLLIAMEQPVATDLRFIIACLNSIRDIERIGDYASHMAKTVITLASNSNSIKVPPDIIKMSEETMDMLHNAMDAFTNKNEKKAEQVIKRDAIVDSLYLKVFKDTISTMEADPVHARQENALIFLAKYVERMADHTANICEEIIYFISGRKTDTDS
jgi:phosphate transport system protein